MQRNVQLPSHFPCHPCHLTACFWLRAPARTKTIGVSATTEISIRMAQSHPARTSAFTRLLDSPLLSHHGLATRATTVGSHDESQGLLYPDTEGSHESLGLQTGGQQNSPGSSVMTPTLHNEANSYQYERLPDETYIRILALQPAQRITDDIFCTIQAAPFSSAQYEALSYSWAKDKTGDASQSRQLYVEGKPLPITQNLFEGLRRLRSTHEVRHLWVDAVCINQSDIPEKNAQVALMAKIYRHAERVPIWLGDGDFEADAACLELLKRLEMHTARVPTGMAPGFFYRSCMLSSVSGGAFDCACTKNYPTYATKVGLLMSGHPLDDHRKDITECMEHMDNIMSTTRDRETAIWWNAFACMAIFSRRYWTRRWVIQELHHAKALVLYWGHCSYELLENPSNWSKSLCEVFRLLSMHLDGDVPPISDCFDAQDRCDKVGWFLRKIINSHDYDYWDKPKQSGTLDKFRDWMDRPGYRNEYEEHGISSWLADCSDFECQDPRDRIFALISMCEPTLRADYNLDLRQTALMLTRHLINTKQEVLWIQNLLRLHESRRIASNDSSWLIDIRGTFYKRSPHDGMPPKNAKYEDMSRYDEIMFYARDGLEAKFGDFQIDGDVLRCRVRCFGEIGQGVDTAAGSFPLILNGGLLQNDNVLYPPVFEIGLGLDGVLPTILRKLYICSKPIRQQHMYCQPKEGVPDRYAKLLPGDLLCSFYTHPTGVDDIPLALLRADPNSVGSHRIIDMFIGDCFRTSKGKTMQDHNMYWTECAVNVV